MRKGVGLYGEMLREGRAARYLCDAQIVVFQAEFYSYFLLSLKKAGNLQGLDEPFLFQIITRSLLFLAIYIFRNWSCATRFVSMYL